MREIKIVKQEIPETTENLSFEDCIDIFLDGVCWLKKMKRKCPRYTDDIKEIFEKRCNASIEVGNIINLKEGYIIMENIWDAILSDPEVIASSCRNLDELILDNPTRSNVFSIRGTYDNIEGWEKDGNPLIPVDYKAPLAEKVIFMLFNNYEAYEKIVKRTIPDSIKEIERFTSAAFLLKVAEINVYMRPVFKKLLKDADVSEENMQKLIDAVDKIWEDKVRIHLMCRPHNLTNINMRVQNSLFNFFSSSPIPITEKTPVTDIIINTPNITFADTNTNSPKI